MKITIIVIIVVVLIWIIGIWISIRNIEEPAYTVTSNSQSYEIRNYEPYIIAETKVSGSYRTSLNKGFSVIADYIFGNNTTAEKIAMTAPVIDKESQSEKIAMTVPVINEGDDAERKVSFVMPSKYTLETIPKPTTDRVTLREVPAKRMAVLRYGWYTNEDRINKKKALLLKELQNDEVKIIGEFSSALYNPPLSMPLLLRNEVMVEVE